MDEKHVEEKLTLLDQLQSACTGCGLCSEACATFQATGYEQESPRGRIQLAAQFLHGRIPLQSLALTTFDRCLACQACEPLCPHHVPYRQIRQVVQELRGDLHSASPSALTQADYKGWVTLAYRIGQPFWRKYGARWLTWPTFEGRSSSSFTKKTKRPLKGQYVLAICCVQDLFQHEVIESARVFMQRLGHSVAVDKNQPCCGAIYERLIQGGGETVRYAQERQRAVSLQTKTLQAFSKWASSNTYFLAQGCHCFVAKHSVQTLDLYAWIETLLDQQQQSLYLPQPLEMYYQPYCGAKKEQQDPIWRLLQRIKGLTVREIPYPLACCGGFCGETFLHPENAQALAMQKLETLPEEATVIVTSPDCWGLFKNYQENKKFTFLYPIQVLAKACFIKKE